MHVIFIGFCRFLNEKFFPGYGSTFLVLPGHTPSQNLGKLLPFPSIKLVLSSAIKITIKQSKELLQVIYTLLFIINGQIEFEVFSKETESQVCLLQQSL